MYDADPRDAYYAEDDRPTRAELDRDEWDATHGSDPDWYDESIRCAHCKGRHRTVEDVRVCAGVAR